MSVTGLACELANAAERGGREAEVLLEELCDQLGAAGDEGAAELNEVLLDLQRPLLQAAALSVTAEAAVRRLLTAAAAACNAREVFTLCMAALSETLSAQPPAAPPPAHGPASPAFQLSLLATLCRCLPRLTRKPMHFLADALDAQLRWANRVLPGLPLGAGSSSSNGLSGIDAVAPPSGEQPAAAQAVAALARLAAHTVAWARGSPQQLSESERRAALRLQAAALLQLAGTALQLPQSLEAAAAVLQEACGPAAAAPAANGRLPAMRAAAAAVMALPQPLLAAEHVAAGFGGVHPTVELQQQLAAGVDAELAAWRIDAAELTHLSAAGAAEGAAAEACAVACRLGGHRSGGSSSVGLLAVQDERERERFSCVLPPAAVTLLDLGAEHRSAALSLLPLCAVCTAGAHLAAAAEAAAAAGDARPGGAPASQLLPASTPQLEALLSALVAVMSHNPVQLLRSCAHDAVHAVLGALEPPARLAQLQRMMQLPSTAAAVVALQRLRQEMAAAWGGSGSGATGGGSLWLSEAALGLALPCLERGTPQGWQDGASVAAAADVQAAALSLLRWVLLRERAAPRGASLLPRQRAQALLQGHLLPLQACVGLLLQAQARVTGGQAAAAPEQDELRQAALDSFLAAQRLSEALDRAVELLQEREAGGAQQAGEHAG